MTSSFLARVARRKFKFAYAHASMTYAILLPALLIRVHKEAAETATSLISI